MMADGIDHEYCSFPADPHSPPAAFLQSHCSFHAASLSAASPQPPINLHAISFLQLSVRPPCSSLPVAASLQPPPCSSLPTAALQQVGPTKLLVKVVCRPSKVVSQHCLLLAPHGTASSCTRFYEAEKQIITLPIAARHIYNL